MSLIYSDNFTLKIEGEKIEPFLGVFENVMPHYGIDGAEFLLYQHPGKRSNPFEVDHIGRLYACNESKSGEVRELKKVLEKNKNARPIIKIKKPGEKAYIIKPTHSRATPQQEADFSYYMSLLGIGPEVIGCERIDPRNPRTVIIVEEFLSPKDGWTPIYKLGGKLNLELVPELFGLMIGKMHGLNSWKTPQGIKYEGHIWYKEGFIQHLMYKEVYEKSDTKGLAKIIDFGEVRVLDLEDTEMLRSERDALENKKRLRYEFLIAGKSLLNLAYYYVYQMDFNKKAPYQKILDSFAKSYNQASGFDEKLRLLDVIG
jgi:hypothetical protein